MRLKSILVVAVLAISSQAWAGIQGIDILDEWHTATMWYRVPPDLETIYEIHEEGPGWVTITDPVWGMVTMSSGFFSVYAGGGGGGTAPSGNATALYGFSPWPDVPAFEFILHAGSENIPYTGCSFSFVDTTTGDELVDFQQSWWAGNWTEPGFFDISYTFAADSSHVYQMNFDAAGDGLAAVWVEWIQPHVIPAPGAILLGSLGVGVVGWLRRRRRL
ncbi:MAG: hypothetical protein ABFE13_13455 [Phycisphaerales bacterium]